LKVKVTGQKLQSPEENVAKVGGMALSEGFLVVTYFLTANKEMEAFNHRDFSTD